MWFLLYLDVVECVKLHEVVQLPESLVGILEVEGGIRRVGIVEDVKVGKLLVLLSLSGNSCIKDDIDEGPIKTKVIENEYDRKNPAACCPAINILVF